MEYAPKFESLENHPMPEWFDEAKFGIFIHWGIYCIPAWAETGKPPLEYADEGDEGIARGFLHNTYTEWYLNTINLEGSRARQHHLENYGPDFSYDNFAPMFIDAMKNWDPEPWAELFESAGARYVVMVTKHHDGFLMWPSRTPNPFKEGWQLERDVVGELAEAVRSQGMKFGLYYSGGLDWIFEGLPMKDMRGLIAAIPQTKQYADYADAHWRELIERYRPSVLWNDIYYPPLARAYELFADYYNLIPDGIVNDRFDTLSVRAGTAHADFVTPEYSTFSEITERKWELCRGMGPSFGFNRNETDEHRLSSDELIHLLIDVTSNNGNLLLNVGPTAEGVIPQPQSDRLEAIGQWLSSFGESIYGTKPWRVSESETADGTHVRFTKRAGNLYAIVLGSSPVEVTLKNLSLKEGSEVQRLDDQQPLNWKNVDGGVEIQQRSAMSSHPAVAFRITPVP